MFKNDRCSLADLLGETYINNLLTANLFLDEENVSELRNCAFEKVCVSTNIGKEKLDSLLSKVATQVVPLESLNNDGAPTDSYRAAFNRNAAPVTGLGSFRIGEDGRLYYVGKSEHYHSSLGHNFPGYMLIDNARKLGVLNATHNNTRGYITRLLESELIRTANGIEKGDTEKLAQVLESKEKHVLNRVINLETGSLAVEAGIKMMLNRFYKQDANDTGPSYGDRIPVFLVMADHKGGLEANYHGTTVLAQTLRNVWPEFYRKAEESGLYKVVSVQINNIEDFRAKIAAYNTPPYKTAGFLHEIVLMNYAGIVLDEDFLHHAYALCEMYDTPKLADEIQSCVWYPELYLFRKYKLNPDFVIIGKGFGGGEYPASKILTTAQMDSLLQFGALVTNGQEELASLAYLVTMRFVQENAEVIEANEELFMNKLKDLAKEHGTIVKCAQGIGFLAALEFYDLYKAKDFAKLVNQNCIDVSSQAYKLNCPPAVLIKLPLITTPAEIDFLIHTFNQVLAQM